jgi:hypothetical protein
LEILTVANLLQPDATINDALPNIIAKEEYVRQIVGNLMQCKRVHGNASVRIGITGDGTAPYNRISYLNDADKEIAFGAFVGASPFKNTMRVNDDTWSTASMTFAEVQALLGELRQFKVRHPMDAQSPAARTPKKRAV